MIEVSVRILELFNKVYYLLLHPIGNSVCISAANLVCHTRACPEVKRLVRGLDVGKVTYGVTSGIREVITAAVWLVKVSKPGNNVVGVKRIHIFKELYHKLTVFVAGYLLALLITVRTGNVFKLNLYSRRKLIPLLFNKLLVKSLLIDQGVDKSGNEISLFYFESILAAYVLAKGFSCLYESYVKAVCILLECYRNRAAVGIYKKRKLIFVFTFKLCELFVCKTGNFSVSLSDNDLVSIGCPAVV